MVVGCWSVFSLDSDPREVFWKRKILYLSTRLRDLHSGLHHQFYHEEKYSTEQQSVYRNTDAGLGLGGPSRETVKHRALKKSICGIEV